MKFTTPWLARTTSDTMDAWHAYDTRYGCSIILAARQVAGLFKVPAKAANIQLTVSTKESADAQPLWFRSTALPDPIRKIAKDFVPRINCAAKEHNGGCRLNPSLAKYLCTRMTDKVFYNGGKQLFISCDYKEAI